MANRSEWVGGLKNLGTGEGEAAPHLLLIASLDASTRFFAVGPKKELLAGAKEALRKAIEDPVDGEPRTPSHLRIGSAELRVALRPLPAGITLVNEPTPEIDLVAQGLAMQAAVDATTRFPDDLEDGAGASFCEGAAAFYEAADRPFLAERAFRIASSREGLDGALVSLGIGDEAVGFMLFADERGFAAFHLGDETDDGEVDPKALNHVALAFDTRESTPDAVAARIDERGWKLPEPDAYPALYQVVEAVPTTAAAARYLDAEIVARGLAAIEEGALEAEVTTAGGTFSITFEPHEVEDEDDDIVDAFHASEEAAAFEQPKWAMLLDEIAMFHFQAPLTELTARQVQDFVYEIIPRRVGPPPEAAAEILAELRAFYEWAQANEAFTFPAKIHDLLLEANVPVLKGALAHPGGTAKLVARPQKKDGAARNKAKAQRQARKKGR